MNLKNKLFLFMALAVSAFVGCSKDDDSVDGEKAKLSVSPDVVDEIPGTGGTVTFSVTTNQTDLNVTQIEGTDSWAHLSGQGDIYNVVVDPNPSFTDPRSTSITFRVEAIKTPVRIKVVQAPAIKPEDMPKTFAIPDFSKSLVYKVMDGSNQVAEVCREYLYKEGTVNTQAIVVYLSKDGKSDLSKGYVAQVLSVDDKGLPTGKPANKSIHGGKVSFGTNAIVSYTEGSRAEVKFLSIGKTTINPVDQLDNTNLLTLEPEQMKDADNNLYALVKIGSQYWMKTNLRTTKYADGTPINNGDNNDVWATANTENTGVYSINPYIESVGVSAELMGHFYNGVALGFSNVADGGVFTDKISPEGFKVPSNSDMQTLALYVEGDGFQFDGGPIDKIKVSGDLYWTAFNGVDNKGNNLSGFGCVGAGYRNASGTFDGGADNPFGAQAFYYTTDVNRFQVQRPNARLTVTTLGFGSVVRLLKK